MRINPLIKALLEQLGIRMKNETHGKLIIEDVEIEFVIRRIDKNG